MRVIRTAVGAVPVQRYAEAWRAVRGAAPGTVYKHGLCSAFPTTREELLMKKIGERLRVTIEELAPKACGTCSRRDGIAETLGAGCSNCSGGER